MDSDFLKINQLFLDCFEKFPQDIPAYMDDVPETIYSALTGENLEDVGCETVDFTGMQFDRDYSIPSDYSTPDGSDISPYFIATVNMNPEFWGCLSTFKSGEFKRYWGGEGREYTALFDLLTMLDGSKSVVVQSSNVSVDDIKIEGKDCNRLKDALKNYLSEHHQTMEKDNSWITQTKKAHKAFKRRVSEEDSLQRYLLHDMCAELDECIPFPKGLKKIDRQILIFRICLTLGVKPQERANSEENWDALEEEDFKSASIRDKIKKKVPKLIKIGEQRKADGLHDWENPCWQI